MSMLEVIIVMKFMDFVIQLLYYVNGMVIFYLTRGVPRIWEGGAKNFFLRFGNLHVAKRCALLVGFGGMLPRENFLKWCVLVYIWIRFFTLKNFKKYHFLYNFFLKCYFLYNFLNCHFLDKT